MDRKQQEAKAESTSQIDRFKETARALACDEDMEAFRAKLRVIARQKPKDAPSPVKQPAAAKPRPRKTGGQ